MDKYTILREFADSWFLIGMVVFFLATIFWVFRPGSRKVYDDISDIPFRFEDNPADDGEGRARADAHNKEARQ